MQDWAYGAAVKYNGIDCILIQYTSIHHHLQYFTIVSATLAFLKGVKTDKNKKIYTTEIREVNDINNLITF